MDANGDNPGREPQRRTGYATQANALFRKNLALQVVALVPRTSEICLCDSSCYETKCTSVIGFSFLTQFLSNFFLFWWGARKEIFVFKLSSYITRVFQGEGC